MEESLESVAELVTGIVTLMLVAAGATMMSKRIDKIPLTILLVFIGIAIANVGEHFSPFGLLTEFHLTPELVLFVFIPTLIFESAFNLDVRQVSRNIWPILTLAVPGLLLSTLVIGSIFAWFTDFSFLVALLLGAILSATDPVAVISIFKQLGVPERLTVLVEGESLFNDATSLVLATLLLSILVSGEFSGAVVLDGFVDFLVVFFGGVIVGWLLALIMGYTLGGIESDPDIEITLTTILAYFAFIIAEHGFHVSGIMAVVAAGLVMGSWGKSKISPSTSEFMGHFWEYMAFLANALIFLMVGLQIDLMTLWQSADLILLVIVAMLISRAVVIFTCVPLLGKLPGSESIGLPFQKVMYWGGLRGAIALAIVLSLPEFEYKDTMIAIVMGAVLFTLVVQGLSIEKLVKALGLNTMSPAETLAKLEWDKNARTEGLQRLNKLVEGGQFSQRVADNLRNSSESHLEQINKQVVAINNTLSPEEKSSTLALRCLAREKARIYELFSRGLINEWAFRELDAVIAIQLDDVRHNYLLPVATIKPSLGKIMDLAVIKLMENIPGLGSAAEHNRTSRIIRDFDVAWGRYRSANSVLHDFDELCGKANSDESIASELKTIYENILQTSKSQIDEVAELYPEFVDSVQEQLGQRLLLVAEHDAVKHAAELGMIQEGIAAKILKDQEQRLRQLKQDNLSAALEIGVSELLAKLPLFNGMEDHFDEISEYLRPRSVPKETAIIKQGQEGDSMFLIARGIARVMIEDHESELNQVATLYAGDFFGEAALLHTAKRNATTVAATPCSLYELKQTDLHKLMRKYPKIKQAVQAVDEQRIASNTVTGYKAS